MGKLSRTKGHNWERQCAAILSGIRGIEAKRNLTEVREGSSGDLEVTGAPLLPECKVGVRTNPIAALRQAVDAAEGTGKIPVVFVRQNRHGGRDRLDAAVLTMPDYMEMVALIKSLGGW